MSIIAKYKFDSSVYADLIPVFNDGYTGYTVSDIVEGNVVTRTIECNTSPTFMTFGFAGDTADYVRGNEAALLEVLDLDVSAFTGNNYLTSPLRRMFKYCINLTKVTFNWVPNTATNAYGMFDQCHNLTEINISNWDTSNITDMQYMFANCYNLTSLDLSNFDTSNVTNMLGMFQYCQSLTSLDVSNFDTSKVTSMNSMFYKCEKLTSLDVSNFNTSNVTNMSYMFYACHSLTSLDVSNWDTSNVTTMVDCFYTCYSLTSLDVSNFDTSNVTNMNRMFAECHVLSSLDVSNWNTSNVRGMHAVFFACLSLTSLDVSNWDTSNATDIDSMFGNHEKFSTESKIKTLNLNNNRFELSKAMGYSDRFMIYLNKLEKVYLNDLETLETVMRYIPDRTGQIIGYIVTTLRDQIDEETIELLSSKNWQIVDIVAQYRFDANTYENLMPEFNAEFTEDKYEVYDSVSDIVIDNIEWEVGGINGGNGANVDKVQDNDDPSILRRSKQYIPIIDNTDIVVNNNTAGFHIDWYDKDKIFISQETFNDSVRIIRSPHNAKYLKTWSANKDLNINFEIKLVTRTIESKNGELPTLMRFGYGDVELTESDIPKHLSLIKILDLNTKELTTAFRMFKYCKRLSTIKSNWNTSKITDMSAMFAYCNNLNSLDVSNFDTSNVTTMASMFNNCNNLTSLDVSGFDTSNVTNMVYMFNGCNNLTSLDVSNFNTINVTTIHAMFRDCNNLTSLDVSNFNTSNVINMSCMFQYCYQLASLDLSNWDTSNVSNIQNMFTACRALTSLDLNNWDTSNVTLMDNAFYNCENLVSVNISDWNTSKVTYMNSLFHNCKKLTTVDVSRWNVGNVIRMDNLFNSCNELVSIDVSNWNTGNVQNMGCLFGWCFKLQSVDLSNWDTSKVVYMSYMFRECLELTSIGDTSNWDTSNVTNMGWMFDRCYKLSSLNVSNWNTSNVTNMLEMFNYCLLITSLDVSNWDTSNVENMRGMFNNCRSLTSLYVNNWDVSKVGETYAMFSDCISLTDLDLTNWDMSKVNTIGYMFDGKELSASLNIPILDLTSLDWSSVTDMQGIFYKNIAKVIKLPRIINTNLSTVISERTEGLYGLFYCSNLVSLDFGGLDLSNLDSFDIANKHLILEHVPKLRYIRTENAALIADLAQYFPARTEAEQGYLITKAEVSDEIRSVLSANYWNVVDLDEVGTDVAIYKFDNSLYKSLVPKFDNNFIDYYIDDVIEDEENEPNIVTRTIRSMGGLPTLMRFGIVWVNTQYETQNYPRTKSLKTVEYANVSTITNMSDMFRQCFNVINIDTSNWDTSNVTNMGSAFENCNSLTSLDLSNWNTSNVTTMEDMFRSCVSLTSLDLSNFNTSKVTTMMGMFNGCFNLTSLDVSNFNTSNVTDMRNMFYNCRSLTSLDLSNFNTSNVTDMGYMFYNCNNLTLLDVSNFDTSNVINMSNMFCGCQSLTSLDVSNFNTGKVNNMQQMFNKCYKLASIGDVSNWNTSNVTNMFAMFQYCQSLTSLDVSNFDTSNVTNMSYMFWDCNKLTSLDVSNFDTSKVTNTNHMFVRCYLLNSLDLSNWNTSKVTNMNSMFWECSSLTSLDVSNFDTSNVTDMGYMFYKCYNLTSLDVSNFDTSKVTDMFAMFSNCYVVTSLDVSNFDTSNVTSISTLFTDCGLLSNIGMIYCNFKTVEKVTSVIPTTNPITIWVGRHIDFNALTPYDHITYKVYEVEDNLEVELSSPLLEGDRLEIIDGDLYHYHKMGLEILNGNVAPKDYYLATTQPTDSSFINVYHNIPGMKIYAIVSSDKFKFAGHDSINEECLLTSGDASNVHIILNKSRLTYDNAEGVKAWLKVNPITLLYELANPYYELIQENVGLLNAEQGLYLNISDSVVPVVNHQDLCTLKLNYLLPNVEYKVKFKANNAGSIAINLGGTLVPLDVVEGWNEVMVTTPETLVDEYLKVNGSEGIKIQNVMVIDSNKDFDYFKGMNNTFDEIPVKSMCTDRTLTYTHGVDKEGVSPQGEMNVNVNKGKVVTVVGKVSNNPDNLPISINLYNDTGRATGKNLFNEDFETGMIKAIDGDISIESTDWVSSKDFIKVKPSTNYITSGDVVNCIFMYDNNYKYIGHTDETYTQQSLSVKTTDNCQYIKIRCYIGDLDGVTRFQYNNIQIEEGTEATVYEPFRNYVNDEPIFINPDGNFAIQIKADRDYANRIGFNVGDASSCEANEQVTITDLMVFEGDILDCHPTTYVDPADTRYLVEYKSIGNPFGFGKNKLI